MVRDETVIGVAIVANQIQLGEEILKELSTKESSFANETEMADQLALALNNELQLKEIYSAKAE